MTSQRTRKFQLRAGFAAAAFGLSLALALPAAAVPTPNNTTYPDDTALVLSGSGVTLQILAGSASSSLGIGTTAFTVTVGSGGQFTVRYPGPNPGTLDNDQYPTVDKCHRSGANNDVTVTGPRTVTFTPTATVCVAPAGGGGGGGGLVPSITISAPNGGETLSFGQAYSVTWSATSSGVTGIRLSLSSDGGTTYPTAIVASTYNSGAYAWTVPNAPSTTSRVKAELLGTGGAVLAQDWSNADFTIVGNQVKLRCEEMSQEDQAKDPVCKQLLDEQLREQLTADEQNAPASDPTATGGYSSQDASADTPTIDVDKGLRPPAGQDLLFTAGTLIKGSQSAVYYYGRDGKRYVFPNQWTFLSWYADFSTVVTVGDDVLATIPIGGLVTYRPGTRMIKIQSDPKVYVVSRGGLLRWVKTEDVAKTLFGAKWNRMVDDVSDSFFFSYKLGEPLAVCISCTGSTGGADKIGVCFSEDEAPGCGTKG